MPDKINIKLICAECNEGESTGSLRMNVREMI